MGGGGLFSTVSDYLRFTRMLTIGGELDGQRVLAAATVDAMLANAMGDLRTTPMHTVNPVLTNDVDFFPGEPSTWGLTFLINETDTPEGRPAGSACWAGLANSYYWIDRKRNISGVFAAQLFPFFDDAAVAGFRSFEQAVNAAH